MYIFIVGHKVLLILLTISASYGLLYMTNLVGKAPKVYSFFATVTVCALTFQMVWYQICKDFLIPAKAVHSYFIHMDWSKNRPITWKNIYSRLPGRAAACASVFRQWWPHVFLNKVFVSTMKTHLYINRGSR